MARDQHRIDGRKAPSFPEGHEPLLASQSVGRRKATPAQYQAGSPRPSYQSCRGLVLTLQGKYRAGVLDDGLTFRKAADQFLKEYGIVTEGERSEKWTESHGIRLRVHLLPFFGDLPLNKVTPGKVQEYRVHRMTDLQQTQSRIEEQTQTEEEAAGAQHVAR